MSMPSHDFLRARCSDETTLWTELLAHRHFNPRWKAKVRKAGSNKPAAWPTRKLGLTVVKICVAPTSGFLWSVSRISGDRSDAMTLACWAMA